MMQSRWCNYSWRQLQSRKNNALRRTLHLHPRASSKIQITSTLLSPSHNCHGYIIQTNRYKSNDSMAESFVRSKRRSRRKSSFMSHPSNKEIAETTKRLLAMNSSLSQYGYALRDFEKHLVNAREDKSLLQKLQISAADARTMLLLPPQLLHDVHKAIMYYSKIDSLVEIEIPAQQTHHRQTIGGDEFMIKNEGKSQLAMETKKVPGPMVCALLLELIGIPQYYSHISLTSSSPPRIPSPHSSSTNYSPIMTVHSSQIDKIMDCCQLTITALSNACRVGKNSLIGYDFNSQNIINNNLHTEKKAAATLAEEIWRSVWNMQILFTSGKRNDTTSVVEPNLPQLPIRIGRIGFLGEQEYNPLTEYLYALRDLEDDDSEVEEFINEQDIIDEDFDFNDEAPSSASRADPPLTSKDQYRYDQAVMMFNAVLNTYANLGNSKSGARPEIRREMVQHCERMLLEVVAREKTKPSPGIVLQHVQPDGISFNTVMKAWAGLSPKQRVDSRNEYAKSVAAATAERTESILEMMYEYHQKERTDNNTLESIRTAWRKCGGGNSALGVSTAIPVSPDTASYNIALTAWAKSSDPNSTAKALELLKRMVHRCNIACTAREAMILENTEAAKGLNARTFNAFPDSRTFVALLASFKNTSSDFKEARDLVLSIFVTMKEWDEQVQWCMENNVGPLRDSNRVLNEFTYNALIRGLSRLPANSWEEQIECCNQIDNIIGGMSEELVTPNAIARGFGINAWAACAVQAQNDKSRLQLCAQKAATHLNELLQDATKFQLEKSVIIHAINDVINLLGKASEPEKATDVFETAKKIQMYNLQSVAAVIESLSKNSHIDISYADKAKQYLFEFEQDKMNFTPSLVLPDSKYTRLYNSVISGYLNCNKKERGLEQAESILSHMIECHDSNPRHIARPNSTSFVPVMSTMAKIGDDSRRCEQLLTKMEKLYQRRNNILPHSAEAKLIANVEPNTVACNAVLKAYARVDDVKSALKLLGRMEKDDVKLAKARPNATTHAIMSTLLSGGSEASFDSDSPSIDISSDTTNVNRINLKDLNLNGRDLKPTSKSFEAMMNIYTSSGTVEGAEKATELLRQIEAMDASGDISFKRERFVHNYNNVINAWVQCENDGDIDAYASKKAEEILEYLCEQHEKGIEALSPNNGSFNLCIKSWCKSGHPNAAKKAEKVLRRKEAFAERSRNDVYITAPNYNLVIAKWRDDKTNGPDRARKLFNEMVQKYGNAAEFKARPNVVTLNSLLDVLAKSSSRDKAEECEELLKEANELFKEGKSTILPDIISYRTCIDAWIRQWQSKISPIRAEALVNEMIHKYSVQGRKDLCPDSDVFNLVLKACSQATVTWHEDVAKKSDTPISIANRAYGVLKGKNHLNIKPTHATYAFMFLIYKNHMDFENSRYTQLLTMLWKQCCNEGLVSQFTLDSFRDSVLQYQFWNAIGGSDRYAAMGKTKPDEVKVDDLPQEWRRNVKPQRRQGKGVK